MSLAPMLAKRPRRSKFRAGLAELGAAGASDASPDLRWKHVHSSANPSLERISECPDVGPDRGGVPARLPRESPAEPPLDTPDIGRLAPRRAVTVGGLERSPRIGRVNLRRSGHCRMAASRMHSLSQVGWGHRMACFHGGGHVVYVMQRPRRGMPEPIDGNPGRRRFNSVELVVSRVSLSAPSAIADRPCGARGWHIAAVLGPPFANKQLELDATSQPPLCHHSWSVRPMKSEASVGESIPLRSARQTDARQALHWEESGRLCEGGGGTGALERGGRQWTNLLCSRAQLMWRLSENAAAIENTSMVLTSRWCAQNARSTEFEFALHQLRMLGGQMSRLTVSHSMPGSVGVSRHADQAKCRQNRGLEGLQSLGNGADSGEAKLCAIGIDSPSAAPVPGMERLDHRAM